MGISAGGSKGGSKSDINVTPLVDVVLVLLIIFLVATPIMLRYVTIEVPRKIDSETEDVTLAARQIVVTVKYDGSFVLKEGNSEDDVRDLTTLQQEVRERLLAKKTDKIVFMDFEDDVPYGDVVVAMDVMRGSLKPEIETVKVALKIREEDEKK